MKRPAHITKRKILPAVIRIFLIAGIVVFAGIIFLNLLISHFSESHLYDSLNEIPENTAGLVLGTSPSLKNGLPNPYFHNRISAAVSLYKAGKIRYIIVSGDNRTRWYNEPEAMRRELTARGIPDSIIYLDFAGLRTLDSVVRSKEIFGQSSFTIISQKFHNQRAVFIAHNKGINAIGFNAQDVPFSQSLKTQLRELFARVKVFFDIIVNKQPRHLGDPVLVGKADS